ncbi:universal stress protein [Piscinibacter sakaiensis]|uniref:universal stress protein n=1 Tax=Piscinibacter sakaiensis TaxID=1547922 RepID=UPI00372A558D
MNILLPVDGSADALAAVRHLVALRRAGLAAEAVLVNVQEPPTLYEVVVAHDAERLSDLRRAAGADLLAPRRCSTPPACPGRARWPAGRRRRCCSSCSRTTAARR